MKHKIIYFIYNKESGDFYCTADNYKLAEQIIKDDCAEGNILQDNMTITELNHWYE